VPRTALTECQISEFRERICRAAAHLFAENGYEAVTLRAIAAEVGCSPMTPYRYFSGKDEIFTQVRVAAFARFADAQELAARGFDDPAERLAALGTAYVEFAVAEPDAYRVMFELHQDSAADHAGLATEGARAWSPMRDAVGQAIDAGVLAGDAESLAHVFWAGAHGLATLHLAGKLELGRSLDELVAPMMTTLFLGNLAPGTRIDDLPAVARATGAAASRGTHGRH